MKSISGLDFLQRDKKVLKKVLFLVGCGQASPAMSKIAKTSKGTFCALWVQLDEKYFKMKDSVIYKRNRVVFAPIKLISTEGISRSLRFFRCESTSTNE